MKLSLGTIIVLAVVVNATIGAICWPYSINSWLLYSGKEASVLWWHGALMAFVPGIGQLALAVAILTWIVMLFAN